MVIGTWLVVWGVLLLLVSNRVLLGWEHLWPCILVVSGVVMLRVLQSRLSFAVVFAATWAILLGIFLTAFAFGILEWERMRSLWPIIPIIIGVSFVVAGATPAHERGRRGGVDGDPHGHRVHSLRNGDDQRARGRALPALLAARAGARGFRADEA
jgi:hypothetical protein